MKSPMRSEIVTRDPEFLDLLLNSGKSREVCDIFGKKFLVEKVAKDRSGGVAVLVEVQVAQVTREYPWNGSGLPPVGTVCEACWTSPDEYYQIKVLAHDDGKAVYCWLTGPGSGELSESEGGILCADSMPHPKLRPIRTPEQIAAEERERAISEMLRIYTDGAAGHCGGIAALYDAGYRRQEPKE